MCYAKSRSRGPERVVKVQNEQPAAIKASGKFKLPDATGFDPFIAQLQRE